MKNPREGHEPNIDFAFDYPMNTLQEILLNQFIKKTAKWLLGENGRLHAFYGNSHWEAALSIDFLSSLAHHLDTNDNLHQLILYSRRDAVKWLLSEKETTEEGLIHWDGVTWDTAVILRSILTIKEFDNQHFSDKEKEDIIETTVNSLIWLFKRFYEWEKEVKYPFGDADVAQILIAATMVKEKFPQISLKAEEEFRKLMGLENYDRDILEDIAHFLISRKTLFNKNENTCYWEDFFQTAEVLEAIVTYYISLKNSTTASKKPKIKLENLRDIIFKTLHTFEVGQTKGMWGTHADTCRALYSYIKCCKLMGIEPESQIVFKSLRWICDEKQTFTDGSFLHTSFITVFYSLALMQIYENWSYSKKKILEIYDDVVWHMEASSSSERGKRLNLEKKQIDLLGNIETLEDRITTCKKVIYSGIWTFLIVLAPLFYGYYYMVNIFSVGTITLLATVYFPILVLIWAASEIKAYIRKEE